MSRACLAGLITHFGHSNSGLVGTITMTRYLVVQVKERRCYIVSPGLSLVGSFPLFDIYVDCADRKHVTINVTEASAGLQGCPPSTTTFEQHVHHPPPPPYRPPFPRLINSNTHPFLRRDVLGIKGWKYIMDCRSPWATTGRGVMGRLNTKGPRITRVATALVLLRAKELAQSTDSK